VTDYLLAEPAYCPRCKGEVLEKTLVEWLLGGNDGHPAMGDIAPTLRVRELELHYLSVRQIVFHDNCP
jgi:hypothetical protein